MAEPRFTKKPETDPKERLNRKLQSEANTIQDQIAQLSSFSAVGGERQDALEHILAAISRLSSEVADAADVLPSYDLRTYTEVVRALTEQVNETNAKLAPQARFQFKASTRGGGSSSTAKKQAPRPSDASMDAVSGETRGHDGSSSDLMTDQQTEIRREKSTEFPAHTINIAGKCGEHVVLSTSLARAASAGVVKDATLCVVDCRAVTGGNQGLASLALRDVTDSLIVTGQVRGSVHVTGLRNCVIVVVARQVRLHECKNVVIYLHCGSHPIIEDCEGVKVSPAPASFLTDIGDASTNQWDQVDDFKWLKAGKSPNWTILPEPERLSDEMWMSMLSSTGKVEDMLEAARIKPA